MAPTDSEPKIGADHSWAPAESGTLRVTRSTTRRRKETNQLPSQAVASGQLLLPALKNQETDVPEDAARIRADMYTEILTW